MSLVDRLKERGVALKQLLDMTREQRDDAEMISRGLEDEVMRLQRENQVLRETLASQESRVSALDSHLAVLLRETTGENV